MTNLERLQHLTAQMFSMWMEEIIDCSNCPCKNDDCPFDRTLCLKNIRHWLDSEVKTEYVKKQAVVDLLLKVADGYKYIEDDVNNLIQKVFELPSDKITNEEINP